MELLSIDVDNTEGNIDWLNSLRLRNEGKEEEYKEKDKIKYKPMSIEQIESGGQ